MTHWDDRTWMDKIRALLAKAEASKFEPEQEALTRKAEALIAKYGIDRAMLYATGRLDEKVVNRKLVLSDPYSRQKAQLLVEIADPLRVVVILNTDMSRGISGFQVHMFGFESDVRRVELLLNSLLVQSALGLATARPAFGPALTGSQLAAFRRDWLAGFGVRVRGRLQAAERRAARDQDATAPESTEQASAGGMSAALVLARRSSLVEQAIAEAYPPERLQQASQREVLSIEAFRSGLVAAASADLGTARSITQTNN